MSESFTYTPRHRKYQQSDRAKKIRSELIANHRAECNKLKDRPCADCKQKYPPYVMEFHHLDTSGKISNVGKMWSYSRETFEKEVAKCIIVCSNCHRIRHHGNKL